MVTSGTGHDRCPSHLPGPIRRPNPTFRDDRKISKTVFGFKRGRKNSSKRAREMRIIEIGGTAKNLVRLRGTVYQLITASPWSMPAASVRLHGRGLKNFTRAVLREADSTPSSFFARGPVPDPDFGHR